MCVQLLNKEQHDYSVQKRSNQRSIEDAEADIGANNVMAGRDFKIQHGPFSSQSRVSARAEYQGPVSVAHNQPHYEDFAQNSFRNAVNGGVLGAGNAGISSARAANPYIGSGDNVREPFYDIAPRAHSGPLPSRRETFQGNRNPPYYFCKDPSRWEPSEWNETFQVAPLRFCEKCGGPVICKRSLGGKTGKTLGRYYYCCIGWSDKCQYFKWVDEYEQDQMFEAMRRNS